MTKKKAQSSGLQSSAGLMRYYEADETTYHLDPKLVVGIGILIGIGVLLLNFTYGAWP